MNAMRLARAASTAAVASIAAWSSWSHMVHVALRFGERPEVAYVLPISVDGMLIVASTVMVDDKRNGGRVRWSARIAFVAGVAASVAANIAAAEPTAGARIVAAWPAVALLLVVEMLARARRSDSAHPLETPPSPEAAPGPSAPNPKQLATTPSARRRRSRADTAAAIANIRLERPNATSQDIADALGLSERHIRRLLSTTLSGLPGGHTHVGLTTD
ncbi:DUF2637 domain-containing protein [Dactylosporangium sp. NBC_01737]|uniref:DUF2637 domain-containing protein n=1 Tax=Dactylosporangium sp. NBC_01737 TaxID=2975959 RepID=UPI002E144148|nr:DUF2637 domain-containing protein [Dactylosporangium sp. NBC_01737]